jgi:hypothetical protein
MKGSRMFGIDDKLRKFADNLEYRGKAREEVATKFAESDSDVWIVQMVVSYVLKDIAHAIKDTLK